MNKNIPHSNGVTLIEFVVAMAITGIALVLIFTVYNSIIKGFHGQIHKASRVQHMLLVKKQVDRAIADISVVASQQEKRLDYLAIHSPVMHSLHCDSSTLFKDSVVVASGVSNFQWALIPAADGSSQAVLTWEACVGNGWTGGARETSANR